MCLVAAVTLCACAGSTPAPATPSHPTVPATSTTAGGAPIADSFEISPGRHLYLECTGTGSPIVLIETGDESGIGDWRQVIPGLIAKTRVCAYERFGNGRSDPAVGCRTMKDLRGDLEALLRSAKVEPPYVLVGASGGGYLVAGYALAHPDQVKGMVFVDTMSAINLAEAPPELRAELKCDAPSNIEHRSYAVVEHEAWDHRRRLGNFPLTVISNDYTGYATNEEERTAVSAQRGWFELSPGHASQVVVTTGHDVPGNQPDVVVKAVLAVISAARVG